MNLENEPAGRSLGPWMIKATGHWGLGRHSKCDFDVFILDLSALPEHDPDVPSGAPSTFIPEIVEDIAPAHGLTVRLGKQELVHGPDGIELQHVDDAL